MAVKKTKYYDETGKSYDGYNIGGKTYKDEAGTQRIDKNSYVQTDNKWYKMGDTNGTEVSTPEFAGGGWIGSGSGVKNNTTESSSSTPTFDNSSYSNKLSNLQNSLSNYNSNINQIKMPKFDTSKMENTQGQIGDLISALQTYQNANSMSRDESNARAYSELNNQYNAGLDKTLNAYNKDAVSRGMFGQLPVEALKQNAISESELNKAKATNDLAGNMYAQDFSMARQKDADFYNKTGQQAGMLGTLYNTESDQYKNAMDEFLNTVNLANMKDQSYFNNINRQLDLLGTQYNVKNNEMDRYASNIGQFSNDYMAEINKISNDNDPTNDWKIGYLQNARNQKISGIEQGQSQAQEKLYKQAMDMFGKLGYASDWIANVLGIPEGTNTADYMDMLADNKRQDAKLKSSGSSKEKKEPGITVPQKLDIWQQATQLAKSGKQSTTDMFGNLIEYQPSYDEIYSTYLQLATQLGYDPYDLMLSDQLETELNQETIQQPNSYSDPRLDAIRNKLKIRP